MKNVSLFIVLIGFLFFSCKKWQRNESHNDFTVEKLIVDTKQTEWLDTKQYIIPKILSLKGSEGMILPQYDKIVFQNGKIYVMDKEITKNVVVFDSLGNYLYKVGEVGRALNELYRQPTNFEVNSQSGNIYLFDSEGRKIIKYDVFGKYYSTDILEDFWPYAFGLTENGNVLHIQVRPQQGEELAPAQTGGQLQIEGCQQSAPFCFSQIRADLVLRQYLHLSLFQLWQAAALSGVGEDQPLRHRLLQTVVQQRVDAPYHTGAKTLVASSPVLKCRENISLGSGVKFFSLLFCKFNTYLRFLLTWLCE